MNTLPFSYREVLRKYSPDEARDSHGEWTDGGSSTTGNGATAQAGRPDAAALPSYERGHVPGAASAVGLHFSTGKRDALDSNHYGTGYKGAERERINKPGVDPRLKQRAYFYVNEGHGTFPESGVGPYRHDVQLTNLYDPAKDGAAVWRQGHGDMNASESAVLNAGYDGYLVHSPSPSAGQGYAVLLGPHHIPVRFLGMGKLAKYSDTEARNSKGEWTTGGTALDEGDPHDHQGMLRVTKENREALVAMLHDQTPKWGSEKEADATHLLDLLLHFAYAPNGTMIPATRAVTIDKGRIVSGAQWRKDGGGNTLKVELVASLVKGEGDLWMNRIEKDAAALHRNVWLEATPKAVDFYARRGYERSKAIPSEKSLTPMVKLYSKIGQATKADAPDDEPIGVLCASGAYAAKLVAGKVSLGLLRKYSPDQPRDAHGMWTSGGGSGPTINYEVAPDPHDAALTARWSRLTDAEKTTLSQHVAQQVAPEVLAAAGITGQSVMQSGGYMGSTNPSIAVNVDGNASGDKVVQAANLLGYALSQDSMMVTSAHAFPGADPVGIITVHIGKADPAAVYDKLWQLQDNGDHLVGGHSTLNGQMNILNFSHLSTEELASRIDAHLSGAYQVDVRQGFAAFPQKADYGQSLPSGFALSAGQSSSQGGADRMRAEANRLIEKELSRIGKVNLAQALKKYAPDQPRDAHGRFADGAVQALFNDNLGISRANMPQVPGRFLPQFLDSLKARGINATREEVRPTSLKATQKDFDPADIKRAMSAPMDIKARPLLVSQDNRVLDGHHRWAGMVLNNDPTAHILRLGLNAKEALDAVRQFSTENDIPARTAKVDLALALLKYSPDQPRDSDGRFAGGGPIADQIPRDATGALNGRQRVAEAYFAEQVSKDPAAALEAYSKLPEAIGGKYINTDTARELSPHYRANPTDMSAAVQEPASWLMKQAYAKQLAMPPVSNSVVFTAGGSGAGKTSAVKGLPAMQRLTDMADAVADGNLANFPSATKRIDQALATGRDVHIVWVGRDPVDAFQNGAGPCLIILT